MNLLHPLYLWGLLLGLPVLAGVQSILLARDDTGDTLAGVPRRTLYRDSAVALALVGAAALWLGIQRYGLEGMGLALPEGGAGALMIWSVAGLAGGLVVMAGAHAVGVLLDIPERPLVGLLMPGTAAERAGFAGVSVAAGLGEELAYRGYALAALSGTMGLPVAVLISSVSFGFAHAYQGPLGILRTAVTGVVFALVTVASGSLWPAVLGHSLVNIILGFAAGDRLLRRTGPSPS